MKGENKMALTSNNKKEFNVGHVDGCKALEVRTRPNSKAEVVDILMDGMRVSVDTSTLNNKYYKIEAVRRQIRPLQDEYISGYCLGKFINVGVNKEAE